MSMLLHMKELNFMFLFSIWITYILWDFVILNKLIEAYGNKISVCFLVIEMVWCKQVTISFVKYNWKKNYESQTDI